MATTVNTVWKNVLDFCGKFSINSWSSSSSSVIIFFLFVVFLPLLSYWLYNDVWCTRWYTEQFRRHRGIRFVRVGNIFFNQLFNRPLERQHYDAVHKYGPVYGTLMLTRPTIVIAVPELVSIVMSKKFSFFPNRREFAHADPLFADNVAFAEDTKWKRLRTIISPAFSIGKLRRMYSCMISTVDSLIEQLNDQCQGEKGAIINMKKMFDLFTIDILIQTEFGYHIDALHNTTHPVVTKARQFILGGVSWKQLLKMLIMFLSPNLAEKIGLRFDDDMHGYFRRFAQEIIARKRQQFGGGIGGKREKVMMEKVNNFLEMMLVAGVTGGDSVENENKYMTEDEIISQCVIFLQVGFDTISSTLSMILYNLALHPDKQDRLYREVEQVLQEISQENFADDNRNGDGNFGADTAFASATTTPITTNDVLNRFPYLNAVIDETLRIHSPTLFIERKVSQPTELATEDRSVVINVHRGDIVHIPLYTMLHDSKEFPSPFEFIPERFLPSDHQLSLAEQPHHAYSILPFGAGPRVCPGKSLALLTMKLCMIHMIRHFRFDTSERTKIPVQFYNLFDTVSPKDMILNVKHRNPLTLKFQ